GDNPFGKPPVGGGDNPGKPPVVPPKNDPRLVTNANFKKIDATMSMAQIEALLGGPGKRLSPQETDEAAQKYRALAELRGVLKQFGADAPCYQWIGSTGIAFVFFDTAFRGGAWEGAGGPFPPGDKKLPPGDKRPPPGDKKNPFQDKFPGDKLPFPDKVPFPD